MASIRDAASALLSPLDEESHLLELPPELQNAINEFVISCAVLIDSRDDKITEPGLLHACRKLREQSELMYPFLSNFRVLLTTDSVVVIEDWAASLTISEIRNIKSIAFEFQLCAADRVHGIDGRLGLAIGEFAAMLQRLSQKGLSTQAVRVTYVAGVPGCNAVVIESFLDHVVSSFRKCDKTGVEVRWRSEC